jgi:hypothetical protein
MSNKKTKTLFILKKRELYHESVYSTVNSGLYNSATFVNNMLNNNDINSVLVEVFDNNGIDKEVKKYNPEIVIIEALWVVPEKFEILQKLHPKVKWLIRIHSEVPFIANEGIAIDWLKKYMKYDNVYITANSKHFVESLEPILQKKIIYLPNYYPFFFKIKQHKNNDNVVNIGLFGAIRPMKNSLVQAIASIIYADNNDKILHLHINTERVEQKGDNALKNIRALFLGSKHKLIEHKWYKHDKFLELVSKMDLGLQIYLSETYNIVTADFISQKIPVVTSIEIPFVNIFNTILNTKNAKDMADKIKFSLKWKNPLTFINKLFLTINSYESKLRWLKYLKNN